MIMVIGIKIRKAGIFIKPKLRGMLVLIINPEITNPKQPNTAIKNPMDAALPIDLFMVYPTNFKIGTFIIAPPMPISEETKPTINPKKVL